MRASAFIVSAIAAAGTLLPGGAGCCATFYGGASEDVRVDSVPSGAEVWLNGDFAGTAPLTLKLDRDTHPLVVLKKEGCTDTRVKIDWTVNPAVLTNAFAPPLIFFGVILDVRSGAACRYAEDDLVVPLLAADEESLTLYGGNVVLERLSAPRKNNFAEGEKLP